MSLIYHYCDADVFLSMIKGDKLWLSSLYYTNDTGELEYFRKLAIPALHKAVLQRNMYSSANLDLQNGLNDPRYYNASFSGNGDDLYQWQAYGKRGKGFAIGFDPELLCDRSWPFAFIDGIGTIQAPLQSASRQSMGVVPVRYASPEQLLGYVNVLVEFALNEITDDFLGIAQLISVVQMISATTKSNVFEAEKETRLLYYPTITYPFDSNEAQVEYEIGPRLWRNGVHGFTPYFEYPNIRQAIKRVVLGPSCSIKDDKNFHDFLWAHGMIEIDIASSKATLR